jgi:probable rRNA maturation factor
MPVDLQLAEGLDPAPGVSAALLAEALHAIRAALDDERLDAEVCVRICGAEESCRLNAEYRGKDKPTNVLSFPAELELPDGLAPLGDLAICWQVVLEEAQAQGKTPRDHFLHLFVHGVLHLLGFDHEEGAAAADMEAREIRILQTLGIADPYSL